MTHIRSLLFGGVCSMAVMSYFVAVDIGYAASAVKNSDNDSAHLVRVADNSSSPAWAAEATINPEYAQDDTSPASAPAAAETRRRLQRAAKPRRSFSVALPHLKPRLGPLMRR